MAFLMPVVEKVGLQLLLEPQTSGMIFRAASSSIGVVLPAYQSYKAIENRQDKSQDEQWLTYWVIYGALTLIEGPTDQSLTKIPYYWHAKFALLLWLQLPQTQGAKVLYTRYLRPVVARFEPKIDVCIDKVGSALMMFYTMYKVPLDNVSALGAYGLAQVMAFFRWFSDPNSGTAPGKGSPPVTGSVPAGQFNAANHLSGASQFITS